MRAVGVSGRGKAIPAAGHRRKPRRRTTSGSKSEDTAAMPCNVSLRCVSAGQCISWTVLDFNVVCSPSQPLPLRVGGFVMGIIIVTMDTAIML